MHPLLALLAVAHSEVVEPTAERIFSRRTLGKRLLLSASALAVTLAAGKHNDVQAAPVTDDWHLGGNTNVTTNGTNFLGAKNVAPLIFKTAATANTPAERMRITPTGQVGIGTTTPTARLAVDTATGLGIFARHTAASGGDAAVRGDTYSTAAAAAGLLGLLRSASPGANAAGVSGQNLSTTSNGAGVRGTHAGGGNGVLGTSVSGIGVQGTSSAAHTSSMAGVVGKSTGDGGIGVVGEALVGNTFGVYGVSNSGSGVYGQASTGVAVTGANIYGGIAMKAQGSAVQSASYGGWAKAMVRMQGDGPFVSAYNGVTGASTVSGSGFTITPQGGGVYNIYFGSGIYTQYRYFSLSGSSSIYLTAYPADTTVQIAVGNASYGYVYYILVF